MPRPFPPSIVTANDLRDGRVIYLAADDAWVRDIARAEVIEDEAVAQLRLLDAERQSGTVVGAALVEVRPGLEGPRPAHIREAFRAGGPTNTAGGRPRAAGRTEA